MHAMCPQVIHSTLSSFTCINLHFVEHFKIDRFNDWYGPVYIVFVKCGISLSLSAHSHCENVNSFRFASLPDSWFESKLCTFAYPLLCFRYWAETL